ncbi:MAG: hypothetical protein AAGM67_08065, partial [Bacteroidota bacterium]
MTYCQKHYSHWETIHTFAANNNTPMHFTRLLFFLVFGLAHLGLLAQSYTISGYVRIGESGETLIGATVAAPEPEVTAVKTVSASTGTGVGDSV